MPIHIRPAHPNDFPRLIELFQEFAHFEKQPERMKNSLDRMKEEQDYFHAFVAVDDAGLIVGYVSYFFCYFTWSGKALHMDDLYVQPAFRKGGIGKVLVQTLIDLAKAHGCHKLNWQVSEWNQPAIEFYKTLGSEISGGHLDCVLSFDEPLA